MASVNKWIGIGRLGRDPETRVMPNGDAATNISIACTESYKDKSTGEKKEVTEWVRISFFRKLAEIAGQYLKKGSEVYIEGKLQTRKWTDKDGIERFTTEIIADTMQMLGGKQSNGNDVGAQEPAPPRATPKQTFGNPAPAAKPAQSFSDMDDYLGDVPF